MAGFELHLEDRNPSIDIDRELTPDLALFGVDHDRLIEGFSSAGMPDNAIDTLQIGFNPSESSTNLVQSTYQRDEHRLKIGVGSGDIVWAGQVGGKLTPWYGEERNLTTAVNYSLAVQSARMAEAVTRHPDSVSMDRSETPSVFSRMGFLGLSSTGGAIVGAQAAAETNVLPVWLGGAVGAATGAAADLAVLMPRIRAKEKAEGHSETRKRQNKRVLEFANSESTMKLFQGVVDIKLAT